MSEFSPTPYPSSSADEIASFLAMQQLILEKQSKSEPFFIGRLSGNEPFFCISYLRTRIPDQNLINKMLFGAGIQFLSQTDTEDYVKTYIESFSQCDMVGVWHGGAMYTQTSDFYEIIKKHITKWWTPICATGLEPFYYMNHPQYDFASIFKRKKVLILSSHSKTIKRQLSKKVFKARIFHETSKLFVHKTPQQNGGNHDTKSWQSHFDVLKADVARIQTAFFDFDIAVVGCGGFGMPICHYIRNDLGKSVIYVGGALQLFFGIMGKRWENSPKILEHVNGEWTRPLDVDKPAKPEFCEGACYW